ncbi:MAG: DNA topoisomerase (ATP-hydrolyzing) subunit B [Patescibacteria group bacterium]
MPKEAGYTAQNITVLEGLEPVRRRPGMYIGGTGAEGLHHLVWEVVDNAIDEAMAGYCDTIILELLPKDRVRVKDNGRGIPVDIHTQTKKSALETVLTTLHAGAKFGEGGGYKVSGGLHGVGVSVVNALSIYTKAEVFRDGKIYVQEYVRGKPKAAVKPVGETKEKGTAITFEPDPEVFSSRNFSLETIINHLRQQAYLTRGIRIIICDRRKDEDFTKPVDPEKCYTFYFEGGISSYVRHINKDKEVFNDPPAYLEKQSDDIRVEVALAYSDDYNEHVFSFANNIYTTEGGSHLTGFRSALTRAINDYAKKNEMVKGVEAVLSGDDTREGLTAVISVKLPNPQFEGQTKAKLGNPEVKSIVEQATLEGLSYWLDEHPQDAKRIVEKCSLSLRARLAAKAARETVIRKGALEGMTLPGKLADCSTRDPKNAELYIVEGNSAGGCFSGDTKLVLADGRNLSFKELIKEYQRGKTNYCYTIKSDGNIGIEKILSPRITKRNTQVIEITLDNNEKIICTPDHRFMLRDGHYRMAKDLENNNSLMPLIERFLNSDRTKFSETVKSYNHKIKLIKFLSKKIDVYDCEVPKTHNFALTSGVFVHNSAKQGRDRMFQAILPLRGKILNVERARLDRMLSSEEIKSLIVAMGVGIGEGINMAKLRYGRVIIMTDADVDGAHIRTLLLTFFYRHFPDLIKNNNLYIAQPPLYSISKGKVKEYAYNDDQKDKIIKKLGKDVYIQRYKGLGEMQPTQLWETTMNPENRVLLKVSVDDTERADQVFSMLMGDEVAPRKRFILTHAKNVKNLDI